MTDAQALKISIANPDPPRYIYALIGPDGVRYIGQTRNTRQRLADHLGAVRKGGASPVAAWISSLPSPPAIMVLESVPASQSNTRERAVIAQHRAAGVDLLNVRVGGECGYTAAIGKLMSASGRRHKGRTLTLEHRARLSAAGVRRFQDPAEREKLRVSQASRKVGIHMAGAA